MRCCGNCEWSIGPELEEEIMEEQGYHEEDLNRPKAGDCAIGMCHNNKYVCKEHIYCDALIDNEVLYDEEYMGPGILIVTSCEDEVVKFMKIVTMGTSSFPVMRIRAVQNEDLDINLDDKLHSIDFTISNTDDLYEAFNYLVTNLSGKTIKTILPIYERKNNLQTSFDKYSASIIMNQDIYGSKSINNYIELTIGDNLTCEDYEYFFKFYQMLNDLAKRKATKEDIQRLTLKK